MKPLPWTILCDFDGTVALGDATDELLARFGRPGWAALEVQWRAGAIGSRACMEGQIALLDCSREELDEFIAGVKIDPRFPEFVAAAAERAWPLIVVSDGLDRVCESVLRRHGLDHVPLRANRLVQVAERRWRLDFPHAATACASGHCKCAQAVVTAGAGPLLLIGDGASDFCVAGQADLVFARGALYDHCVACAIACEAVSDFGHALRLLSVLPDRRIDATMETVLR